MRKDKDRGQFILLQLQDTELSKEGRKGRGKKQAERLRTSHRRAISSGILRTVWRSEKR
jgi:hypothetical protein